MCKSNNIPFTQEYLKLILRYDSESGQLRWKQRPDSMFKCSGHAKRWNDRYADQIINCINNAGYIVIKLHKRNYLAHRIIWLIKYGEQPNVIDHIDRNKTNNSIHNLRSVSQRDNTRNSSSRSSNKTGVTGVSFNSNKRTWIVQIVLSDGSKFTKNLHDFFEACCLRKSLEISNGYITLD